MTSTLRAVAESRFAAITRREETAMNSVEEEQRTLREKTARLRALRLDTQARTIQDQTMRLETRRRADTSA